MRAPDEMRAVIAGSPLRGQAMEIRLPAMEACLSFRRAGLQVHDRGPGTGRMHFAGRDHHATPAPEGAPKRRGLDSR